MSDKTSVIVSSEEVKSEFAEIELYVRQVEVTDEDGKTRKFNAYHTYDNRNHRLDVGFPQDVKNVPTENCVIRFKRSMANVDRARRFPKLWVKEIIEIKSLPEPKDTLPF